MNAIKLVVHSALLIDVGLAARTLVEERVVHSTEDVIATETNESGKFHRDCCFLYNYCFKLGEYHGDGFYIGDAITCTRHSGYVISSKQNKACHDPKIQDSHGRWLKYATRSVQVLSYRSDNCEGNDYLNDWFVWGTGQVDGDSLYGTGRFATSGYRPETEKEYKRRKKREEARAQEAADDLYNSRSLKNLKYAATTNEDNVYNTDNKYVPYVKVIKRGFLASTVFSYKILFKCTQQMLVCFVTKEPDVYSSKGYCDATNFGKEQEIAYNSESMDTAMIQAIRIELGDPWNGDEVGYCSGFKDFLINKKMLGFK